MANHLYYFYLFISLLVVSVSVSVGSVGRIYRHNLKGFLALTENRQL